MRRLLAAAAALLLATACLAQEYGFELPTVLMEAWVEPDGSLTIEETFDIRNAPDAKALDGVDVGVPSTQWSLSRVTAWIDDREIRDIVKSPYVRNAVAANLPDGGLAPGASAKVRVRIEGVGGLLFADTTAEDRVSLRITPTWFDGKFVRGESFVRVVAHLPPGVEPASLTWHAVPWIAQVVVEATPGRPEHAAVAWERTYRFTGPFEVGVSFPRHVADPATGAPREVVANVREITTWDLFESWAGRPGVRLWATGGFLLAFTIIFFWATRRTGCVLWAIAAFILFVAFQVQPALPILLAPALPLLIWAVASARTRRKRQYVPAVASVEGGGIKRGLTAPEAACLLEAPPEKILLLVLYGLSRKGLVTLEPKGEKGLLGRTTEGFGRSPELDVKAAAEKGTVLHPYESPFLKALLGKEPKDVGAIDWTDELRGVAKHAASRLSGYDVEQTKAYYEQIVARAWKEAGSIGDVELRKQAVDRAFDWLVLDRNAYGRMDGWHRAGWRYRNPWIPGPAIPAGTGASLPTSGGAPPAAPGASAGDVAGSVGGRLENLAGGFATALGLGGAPKGALAGFDKVVSQALQDMSKSAARGGGGGGGSSCACACAGCACACACAGGGR